MSEADLQAAVIELAKRLGWRCAHFRAAQIRPGRYVTPVSGDGAGFPDLVMLRDGRIVAAELKTARGRVSAEQQLWLAEFRQVLGVAVHVWRPAHWLSGEIENTLRGVRSVV